MGTSALAAAGFILVGLALSWLLSRLVGGAGTVVPHWYYVPIIFGAVRFGHTGAAAVALVAGVLAGPLTPQDVSAALSQSWSEWLTRTGFFVLLGQLAAVLVTPSLPSLGDDVQRIRLERSLRLSMRHGELTLHYQPIVSLASGRLVGAEALVRWHHSQRGYIPAGAFVPIIERGPTIHELGAVVLRQACQQAARWQDEAQTPCPVSVNLSAAELDAPGLCTRVQDVLDGSGLDPSLLCLEVTESALVEDLDGSVGRLEELGHMGVSIAIDDFGTGYSSLSYVHRFPAHALKIDRSFTQVVDGDQQGEAVMGGIVLLARSLGVSTIAEGVETAAQAARLAELDCELVQGFYYARPMPADRVTDLLHAGGQIVSPSPHRSRMQAQRAPRRTSIPAGQGRGRASPG